ncbi:Hypothetical protein R9X50_00222200 [Acrodontium crateriforme]|uniref:Ankyrin repeat protein n=1 Tax=Acrodontium crateriforme TaxID=150365 RepID=A0AAQ3M0U4_9PEZI|nr:Hypothetical protein R9X50_00222200 [Acrodontium crateriforme]
MAQIPTIDRLLSLVPDAPDSVLNSLRSHPQLASQQDAHGYSLLHAATSYGHVNLLKALVEEFKVDQNIVDEDGETCLFNVETIDMAKEVLALGVKIDMKNTDGQTAAEKLDDEDEQPEVAAFLKEIIGGSGDAATQNGIANGSSTSNGIDAPSPLPNGVRINMGLMDQSEEGGEPDPEFRRRIDELAARPDFESEETQRELRELVSQALTGFTGDGQGPSTKRRMG